VAQAQELPGGKLNGAAKVGEFLANKPEVLVDIRKEVLDVMVERKLAQAEQAKLKAV
jgi:hypothetical protein